MKFNDLRGITKEELKHKLDDLNKELMKLQFKRRSGVEKPHLFKKTKKTIARVLTLLNKKEGA